MRGRSLLQRTLHGLHVSDPGDTNSCLGATVDSYRVCGQPRSRWYRARGCSVDSCHTVRDIADDHVTVSVLVAPCHTNVVHGTVSVCEVLQIVGLERYSVQCGCSADLKLGTSRGLVTAEHAHCTVVAYLHKILYPCTLHLLDCNRIVIHCDGTVHICIFHHVP